MSHLNTFNSQNVPISKEWIIFWEIIKYSCHQMMSHHWRIWSIWISQNYYQKNLLINCILICSQEIDKNCEAKCEEWCTKFHFIWFCWINHAINSNNLHCPFKNNEKVYFICHLARLSRLPVFTFESYCSWSWPSIFITLYL